MKKYCLIVYLFVVLIILGCAGQTTSKKQLYTAHNIWIHKGDLKCINYKIGETIVPAGTPIKDLVVNGVKYPPRIEFYLSETDQKIKVFFNKKWHPGQTVESYANKMLTEKTFAQLTQGLNPDEIKSIKKGVLTVGMSKRAVLISYGTPPEHFTSNLSNDKWFYWLNKRQKKKICFENDCTIRCKGPNEL